MFNKWSSHYSPMNYKISDKLLSRVYKGIPDSIRNKAWSLLLDVPTQMKAQAGVYEVSNFKLMQH
jgi:hypothetical protein